MLPNSGDILITLLFIVEEKLSICHHSQVTNNMDTQSLFKTKGVADEAIIEVVKRIVRNMFSIHLVFLCNLDDSFK